MRSVTAFLQDTSARKKLIRFAASGVLATAVHFIVAMTCIEYAGIQPFIANGIAFAVANVFSYIVNALWSFEAGLKVSTYLKFLAASSVGLFFSMAISGAAQILGLPPVVGVGLVVVILPLITFTMHHLWTFR